MSYIFGVEGFLVYLVIRPIDFHGKHYALTELFLTNCFDDVHAIHCSCFFFQHTDYDVVVNGYGGVGLKLESDDLKEIYDTFQKAKELAADGKPVVINALIGKSDFRAGSISV